MLKCGVCKDLRSSLLDLKNNTRRALSSMLPDDHSILYARYESSDRSFVDVENVLFYNIGAGGFSHLKPSHLIFERTFSNPIESHVKTMFPHCQYYTTDSTFISNNWSGGQVMARFSSEYSINSNAQLSKADYFWYALKKATFRRFTIFRPIYFGLNLTIHSGNSIRRQLLSILKPMLDGIVAALQVHDGSNREFARAPSTN